MAEPQRQSGVLNGWKEIARHLGRTVRTVQQWEKTASLPIYPPAGSSGGPRRIIAYTNELDAWLHGGHAPVDATSSGQADSRGWIPARLLASAIAAAVLVTLLAVAALTRPPDPGPTSVAIERNGQIVAFNASGQTLWTSRVASGAFAPATIADLDGDGRNEALVAIRHEAGEGSALVCFTAEGATRWVIEAPRTVRLGGRLQSEPLVIRRLSDFPAGRASRRRYVAALAHGETLSQLSLIDQEGVVFGEYWHTGEIHAYQFLDPEGDGQQDIVLGGINRMHGNRAFLALIPPTVGRAVSPIPPGYAPGLVPGRERYYFLFPHTDLAAAIGLESHLTDLHVQGSNLIAALQLRGQYQGEERIYHLNERLQVLRLDFARPFLSLRRLRQGRLGLPYELSAEEEQRLRQLDQLVPALP